jgi:hypothetical protein
MPPQQRHVAAVGTKHHVKGVAEERHRADDAIDRDIGQHPRDQMTGRTELARLSNDVKRNQSGNRIADTGDESDHRVEAETDIGSRNDEGSIEQIGKRIEPRNPLSPRLRPRKSNP